jgi:hypothetical protein
MLGKFIKISRPRITGGRIAVRFVIFLLVAILSLYGIVGAQEDDSFELVGEWLDANEMTYLIIDEGTYALAFEGDNVERVDIHIDFSDDFVHFGIPLGFIPEEPGEEYLWDIITIIGTAPMIKPVIDEERFFFLALDLPKAALSEDELINDLLLMIDFTDVNIAALAPDLEEN